MYKQAMYIFIEGKERMVVLKSTDGLNFNKNDNFDGWGDDLYTYVRCLNHDGKLLLFQTLKDGNELWLRIDTFDGRDIWEHETHNLYIDMEHARLHRMSRSMSNLVVVEDKM